MNDSDKSCGDGCCQDGSIDKNTNCCGTLPASMSKLRSDGLNYRNFGKTAKITKQNLSKAQVEIAGKIDKSEIQKITKTHNLDYPAPSRSSAKLYDRNERGRYERPAAITQNRRILESLGHCEVNIHPDMVNIALVGGYTPFNPCTGTVGDMIYRMKHQLNKNYEKLHLPVAFDQSGASGVSDGISMGTDGMNRSLSSREFIAMNINNHLAVDYIDGTVAITGCDKPTPGIVNGLVLTDKPFALVYAGSALTGPDGEDIITAFESSGSQNDISESDYQKSIDESFPSCGTCQGGFTSNTMAMAFEAMGAMLPGSASTPAIDKIRKDEEFTLAAEIVRRQIADDNRPSKWLAKTNLINAFKVAIVFGGSTNVALHLLAVARYAGIDLDVLDLQKASQQTPVLCNMRPWGTKGMVDLDWSGGSGGLIKYLIDKEIIDGTALTFSGKTLAEEYESFEYPDFSFEVVQPISDPFKKTGHLQFILSGNLAPKSGLAKLTDDNKLYFKGDALVFESEEDAIEAFDNDPESYRDRVVFIRGEGPKGAPGMPEMLAITARVSGYDAEPNNKPLHSALLTDARFSGGTRGFCIAHIAPEAYVGGPIGILQNGDEIEIDFRDERNYININISDDEFNSRMEVLQRKVAGGYDDKDLRDALSVYRQMVTGAEDGAVFKI